MDRRPSRQFLLVVSGSLLLISGCAMCASPYDEHFPSYGGSRQRGDRVHGRVASAFNDAEAIATSPEGSNDDDYSFEDDVADPGQAVDTDPDSEPLNGEVFEVPSTESDEPGESMDDLLEVGIPRTIDDLPRGMIEIRENARKIQQPFAGGQNPPQLFSLSY